MKNQVLEQVIGVPMKSTLYQIERMPIRYLPDAAGQYRIPSSAEGSIKFIKGKGNFVLKRMNKLGKKADTFAHGVREHVRVGPKITETVKGKLSLGARILQVGSVDKIFKQLFSVGEGEKLLKACQCYISTTAGPIAGLLFTSSQKVAFCSDRSIKIPSPDGEFLRFHYKVLLPLEKIKGVNESENVKKPSQKYMEIVTVDDFEFWFMGFLNYQKAFKYLQQAISQRYLNDVLQVTF
ncbi:GEM-like protein 7 [Hibiscus syriacus]|uniref:GEM-like protein 7 n=1 Tax=Hibiscus syriacus TaxID=106335 RepID=A0A6A2Z9J6_HIBSY|nr:putative GEM-like protein 8 [Hibiscus syriacus]KAE8687752.1 GEM-like protein 7 [Hibiscus syriacus]